MAKNKKGKQKQDEVAAGRTVPATIPEENENEEPEKVQLSDVRVTALGAFDAGHHPWPTPPAAAKIPAGVPHPAGRGGGGKAPAPPPKSTVFGPATDEEWSDGGGGGGHGGWDDEEYESYSEDDYSPPPSTMPAKTPGWQSWGEEARRLSKATAPPTPSQRPPGLAGADVSAQQRAQILNSLLSQTPQNNNYLYAGAQQHKQRAAAAHGNPYPGVGGGGGGHNPFPGHQANPFPGHQPPANQLPAAQLAQLQAQLAGLKAQKDMKDKDKKRKHASAPDPWAAAVGNTGGAWGGGGGGWGQNSEEEDYDEEDEDDYDEDPRRGRVRFASRTVNMAASKSKDPWATTAPPAPAGGGGGWGADDGGWGGGGGGGGGGGADKGGGWGNTKDDEWGDAGWGETAGRGGGGGGGGGWGDTKSAAGGWGDNKSAAGGWGDTKPTAGGWGDTKSAAGGWGDTKSAAGGGWGDTKTAGGGWGDSKSAGGWGAEPSNPPAGGGWGGMGDSGGGGWGGVMGTPQSGASDLKKKSHIPRTQDTGYIMPSKTLTHAQKGTNVPLQFVDPHNKLNEYTNVKFVESGGEALQGVARAFFGKERKARERFRWSFSPDKDPRVSSVLDWIDAVSYSLGAFGLHKFLQSQERGALVVNAAYRAPKNPNEPAFDWMTFDQSQKTKDKILQESIALYDPDRQIVVFVFLPSHTGNSVAIWRRKINIPNNIKLMLQAEIQTVLAGLRRDEDYVVHVDEIPGSATSPHMRRGSIPPLYTAPDGVLSKKKQKLGKLPKDPNKKKRPWWKIF